MPGLRVHLVLHPLRPPQELHAALPPPTLMIVGPAGLPWRTKLMVRSTPPTQRPPTGSAASQVSSSLLRAGGVVSGYDLALGPREAGQPPPSDLEGKSLPLLPDSKGFLPGLF
ncbi:unnamed protein product [Nyctereutes procyonoides]|uniref:(raccoon dog) hypothetical protein n=1 Tax=Nyctereutes procyonoides TaxID=34880 RepID=A0A811ZV63_NYCPR|nr:unnamed protein product [Nyctereutes procyonoides]